MFIWAGLELGNFLHKVLHSLPYCHKKQRRNLLPFARLIKGLASFHSVSGLGYTSTGWHPQEKASWWTCSTEHAGISNSDDPSD